MIFRERTLVLVGVVEGVAAPRGKNDEHRVLPAFSDQD